MTSCGPALSCEVARAANRRNGQRCCRPCWRRSRAAAFDAVAGEGGAPDAAADARRRRSEEEPAEPGCPKCRWSRKGCGQCRGAAPPPAPAAADDGDDDAAARPLPPPPITSAGISSRPEDVQVYAGLTPHGLSEAQIDELFEAIAAMRKAAKATEFVKHGWTLQWKVRQNQGGSTRGDMCIIDPRDGQKIYSIVGLKRKMGLRGVEPPQPAMRRQLEGDDATIDRQLGGLWDVSTEELLNLDPKSRRGRAAKPNYAEASGETGRGPRMPEQVLAALQRIDPEGNDGADFAALALEIGTAQQQDGTLEEGAPPPFNAVRQALTGMLRTGRLRRRLASQPPVRPGDTASALRALVLSNLQVEHDADAPWSLEAEVKGDDESRTHVWKGLTPSYLPRCRRAALVGRRVEIWWAGDGRFHAAKVTRYCRRDGDGGPDCDKGCHVVEYEGTGLCAIEPLEIGDQEPQQWRLVGPLDDADRRRRRARRRRPPPRRRRAPAAAAEEEASDDDDEPLDQRKATLLSEASAAGEASATGEADAAGEASAEESEEPLSSVRAPTKAAAARRRRRRTAARRRRRARAATAAATAPTATTGGRRRVSSRASRHSCRSTFCASS